VKIRGGWDDNHLNAVEVARMAADEGIDAITVHPRTQSQRYTGKAPWDIIREVVEAVSVPVTGNGDVTSMAEARAMVEQTGCQSVMIGRGALGRPWVFDEELEALLPPQKWERKTRVIERHVALMAEHFAHNPRYGLTQLRKHLAWYTEGIVGMKPARAAIHGSKHPEEALEAFWRAWHNARDRDLQAVLEPAGVA
jgi:tRNA-dihydrouridine synthase